MPERKLENRLVMTESAIDNFKGMTEQQVVAKEFNFGFSPYFLFYLIITKISSLTRRFGYADNNALADGRNGTDCRGEEHDVTITWSITSGKRSITMDGSEVHYSTNRASVLEFSWQARGNHVIKVVCHAAPPLTSEPGFRQYDLSIDGQSFFEMPKVYQLGISGAASGPMPGAYRNNYSSSNSGYTPSQNMKNDAPLTREQEEADLRRAIQESISESKQHLGQSTASTNDSDLLGFAAPPAAPPISDTRSVASYLSAPTTYGNSFTAPAPPSYPPAPAPAAPSVAAGAIVPAVAPPGYYQGQPPPAVSPTYAPPPATSPTYASPPPAAANYPSSPAPPSYAAPAPIPPAFASPPPAQPAAFTSPPPVPPAPHPTPAGDVFGIQSTNVDPFAPKPVTHETLASAIMASYQASPPGVPQTPTADSVGVPTSPDVNGGVTLSMSNLSVATEEEKPKSEFEKALSNLVNVDHIEEPAYGARKLTMMKKEEPTKKVTNGKSVPLPPAGAGLAGTNAPLSQIKKDFHRPQNTTSEGIMNAPPPGAFHPNAAQSGALVVHGQGPPPLQQAQGFGVGSMLPNGGFQNQQNLAPGYMQQQKLHY